MNRSIYIFSALALTVPVLRGAEVSFNRDIRPILSDKCFHCHGPDEKERKSKLRMDSRESALKGGKSGEPAIVPGKPEASELIKRITTKDEDDLMPPAKLHKPVSKTEVDLLRKWIAGGAEYAGHWAFIPPERPAVPAGGGAEPKRAWFLGWKKAAPVTSPQGAGNAVDAFIRAVLPKHGLQPSPEADRATLIRRATLDLTGLPPSLDEIAAFEADASADAYEKLVDRLLASPRYGEHMAAQWLDLARYADSNGFQSDTKREMHPWRDWVIRALNENKPFDQFTVEQLAGDLLPDARRDQIVATGFNRNHRLNGEGGRIVEEWFAETVIDRVETTGLTWLALTVGCARCHDHKYDPITQKEFYQLFAYFNSNEELGVMDEFGGAAGTRKGGNSKPVLVLPTPEQERQLADLEAAAKAADERLAAARKELPALQAAWEKDFSRQLDEPLKAWEPLAVTDANSVGGATLAAKADGSWLAGGTNPANDTYELEGPLPVGEFTGLLLEVLPDEALPNKSLGRGSNGNFVLSAVEAEITVPGANEPLVAVFTRAQASYEQKGYEIARIVQNAVNAPKSAPGTKDRKAGAGKPGWAVDGNDAAKRIARKAMFVCEPLSVPAGAKITVRLMHGSSFADHNIGRFRLSTTALAPATVKLDGAAVPDDVRTALKADAAKRTPKQKEELEKFFRENGRHPARQAELSAKAAKKAVDDLKAAFGNTMVFRELPQPKPAFVLLRGEYDKLGPAVSRALPAVLPPLPEGAPNNRLGFAQWLVSGGHPLTARVWVNRAWERFFGAGIVRTTENFGSQADWPTHPELLDWLATEFVRLGWDMKAMHRLLVTSATYRQSSAVTPQMLEKDPDNRLLARAPRLRLPAETLRDQALAVSGLLVEKVGGPSVRPYMPAAVWDETSVYGDMRNYMADQGEGLYRRTLYTIWKRTAAPPSMLLFDSPSREICTVKRSRSNTPTQALSLLNEVTFVESARKLAEAMLRQGGTKPEERIAWAFRRITSRRPDPYELGTLAAGLRKRLEKFAGDAESARQLIAQGESRPDPALDPSELAAYTVTANVLLNLDETVTRN